MRRRIPERARRGDRSGCTGSLLGLVLSTVVVGTIATFKPEFSPTLGFLIIFASTIVGAHLSRWLARRRAPRGRR